jgi:hypothetical protein
MECPNVDRELAKFLTIVHLCLKNNTMIIFFPRSEIMYCLLLEQFFAWIDSVILGVE